MYGLILDSIEANVENAQTHVEGANIQLSKASLYQVKSNISLEILFFFIKKHTFHKGRSATSPLKRLHEGTSLCDYSPEEFTRRN